MKYCSFKLFEKKALFGARVSACFVMGMLVGVMGHPQLSQAQSSHKEQHSHKKSASKTKTKKVVHTKPSRAHQHKTVAHGVKKVAPAAAAAGAAVALPPPPPTATTPPAAPPEPEKGTVTGRPIPRFLSLRADEVNMRAGPGTRYPIVWVYHRRDMPVKLLREFDVWRLVEDVDGQKGWVQQAVLSGTRSFIIAGEPLSTTEQPPKADDASKKNERTGSRIVGYVANISSVDQDKNTVVVREQPQDAASPVAVLKPGVVGVIKECPAGSEWCRVKIKSYTGWIPRNHFWGLLPDETIQTP